MYETSRSSASAREVMTIRQPAKEVGRCVFVACWQRLTDNGAYSDSRISGHKLERTQLLEDITMRDNIHGCMLQSKVGLLNDELLL
eukprot:scaffold267922_cov14-Prasinocladus_malaysianus.AAC.1